MPERIARTTELGFGITAIDTEYVRPMHDASHLIVDDGSAAFVDTGTNDSVDLLMNALERSGYEPAQVQYVFLTHVHLDHAGGAGALMRRLPNAQAVLHPRGAPHMSNPARLIEGAQAVYGEAKYREMYGEIEPIPRERIVLAGDEQAFELGGRTLTCLYTEGHARHHYCLADPASEGVFTGDSFGVSYRVFDTAAGEFIFPTTTPVHFDPPEAHKAIDRIMSLGPRRLYLTHYSQVTDLPRLASDMHRHIDAFVSMAERHVQAPDRTSAIQAAMFAYLRDELARHGFEAGDERLRALLDGDVQLNTMGLEHWLDHRK